MNPRNDVRAASCLLAAATSLGLAWAAENDVLDAGFGPLSGRVAVPFDLGGTFGDFGIRVLRRSDGRYVVIGSAQTSGPSPRVAIARLTESGFLDTSFGSGGKLDIDLCMHAVNDAALDPSDRILILGTTFACGTAGSEDARLARLTPAGALDASFSGSGVRNVTFTTVTAAQERGNALVLRDNGEILVGGGVDNDGSATMHLENPAFRRLDANGNDIAVYPGASSSVASRIVAGRPLPDGGVVWAINAKRRCRGAPRRSGS